MNLSVKISLAAAGAFLMTGLLTGVWKYIKIMASPEHRAPVYVDIAHRASFLYSFASLVIAQLIVYSPFGPNVQVIIVALPLIYFAIAVASYIREGILNRSENMFAERNFETTWIMYSLIAAEIGGFALIFGGFLYTVFF
jgi:hypothetical protein